MSATDELRRMLDERGVVWTTGYFQASETYYEHDGNLVLARERTTGNRSLIGLFDVNMSCLTTEQAIAATIGSGECHDVAIEGEWFECSECRTVKRLIHPNFCPNCGRRVVE